MRIATSFYHRRGIRCSTTCINEVENRFEYVQRSHIGWIWCWGCWQNRIGMKKKLLKINPAMNLNQQKIPKIEYGIIWTEIEQINAWERAFRVSSWIWFDKTNELLCKSWKSYILMMMKLQQSPHAATGSVWVCFIPWMFLLLKYWNFGDIWLHFLWWNFITTFGIGFNQNGLDGFDR